MIYFDTSYIVRLYYEDVGWRKVRELASNDHIVCCLHGRTETVAAFHRKFREGSLSQREFHDLLEQFDKECAGGAFQWLPLSATVVDRFCRVYASLSKAVTLRAADAIHLSCAADKALKEIYTNDQNLLTAASHFGLKGINII